MGLVSLLHLAPSNILHNTHTWYHLSPRYDLRLHLAIKIILFFSLEAMAMPLVLFYPELPLITAAFACSGASLLSASWAIFVLQ